MRTLYAVLVALLVTVPASAQDWLDGGWIRGSCDRCRMISFVDVPGWSGFGTGPASASKTDGLWLAGWGFICEQGGPADRIDVWYQKGDGFYATLDPQRRGSVLYTGLRRPDVRAAFAAHCPGLADATGWHVYLAATALEALPLGPRNIVIKVWRGPYYETHYRTVIIVP